MRSRPSCRLKRRALVFAGGVLLLGMIAALCWGAVEHVHTTYPSPGEVRPLSGAVYEIADGRSGAIELPGALTDIAPRTAVTLSATINANAGESLLIKTVYTQLRLYADGELIYTCGQDGSYPAFLIDPPTILTIVPLPKSAGEKNLRFEYVSSAQRSAMSLPVVLVGHEMSLFKTVMHDNAFSLLFSLLLILIGAVMVIAALIFLRDVPSAVSFLWLGLFAVATGIWVFGECDLTAFLLPHPSLTYALAFIGLFTLGIAFMEYGLVVMNPRNRLPMRGMALVLYFSAAAAFALQLTGRVGLSRSMYLFHILIPVALMVFVACLVWEAVRHKNQMARRLVIPIVALTATAILERINYTVRITNILSLFFQGGVVIFLMSLGVIGGRFVRDAARAKAEKSRLEMQVAATTRQLSLQREQYDLLTSGIEAAKKARHDLRHHVAALIGCADRQDVEGMKAYLTGMVGSLAATGEAPLCENYAVNAIAQHYQALAKRKNIRSKMKLNVPDETGRVLAADLCIIFGNLMENAIEACGRMSCGERILRLNADVKEGYLIVTAENSFDGDFRRQGGVFYSRKRNYASEGVGLSSVRAIAEKYGGYVEFSADAADAGVFTSSAVVRMQA